MSDKVRMLVLEGIDGSGKTTFAESLEEPFVFFQEMKWLRPTVQDVEVAMTVFEYLDKSKIYVFDRYIVSDIVYNTVLRLGKDVPMFEALLKDFCDRFNALFVIFQPPKGVTSLRDDKITLAEGDYIRIKQMYHDFSEPGVQIIPTCRFADDYRAREIGIKRAIARHFKIF